ncbi:MAG: hypothetical protein [Bacteriophage sp.]|nr:MAG: hypothetical protein [Bacteriophage sp.]
MKIISKIMRSMRDTGLLDGMSDEDADTLATAALEAMRSPTPDMYRAGVLANVGPRSSSHGYIFEAMIDAALNE